MKEGQEKIYYVTAETFNAAKNSPHLEIFQRRASRCCCSPIASMSGWSATSPSSTAAPAVGGQGWPRPGQAGGRGEKRKPRRQPTNAKELIDKIKASLGERVKDVRVTHRLTDSPPAWSPTSSDPSGNLARPLKAAGQKAPDAKPILEINPNHPAVQRLGYEGKPLDDWAALLFEQGMLASRHWRRSGPVLPRREPMRLLRSVATLGTGCLAAILGRHAIACIAGDPVRQPLSLRASAAFCLGFLAGAHCSGLGAWTRRGAAAAGRCGHATHAAATHADPCPMPHPFGRRQAKTKKTGEQGGADQRFADFMIFSLSGLDVSYPF